MGHVSAQRDGACVCHPAGASAWCRAGHRQRPSRQRCEEGEARFCRLRRSVGSSAVALLGCPQHVGKRTCCARLVVGHPQQARRDLYQVALQRAACTHCYHFSACIVTISQQWRARTQPGPVECSHNLAPKPARRRRFSRTIELLKGGRAGSVVLAAADGHKVVRLGNHLVQRMRARARRTAPRRRMGCASICAATRGERELDP